MKKLIYLSFLLASILFLGCEKEGTVKIDSVLKNGDTFYMGQKVQVWVGAQISDLADAKYTWSCSGGSFSGPSGLNQTVWVAPRKNGEYMVTCKVECNGASEERSTKMIVDNFFFDYFSNGSSNWSTSNLNATYKNGEVQLTGSKSNTRGTYKHAFGDTSLTNPFTVANDMAWRTQYKGTTSSFYYRLFITKPTRNDGSKVEKYIREIRLEVWPTATTGNNYKLTYEVFNSVFSQATTYTMDQGRKPEFFFTNGDNATDKKGMRPFSISVTDDYRTVVKLDGNTVIDNPAIQTWRNTYSIPDKLILGTLEFDIYEKTNFFVDNVIVTKDDL